MSAADENSNALNAFNSIVQGIWQGQAARARIRQSQLEEIASRAKAALDNQTASMDNAKNVAAINQFAQPVNSDNTVNQPTVTTSSPLTPSSPNLQATADANGNVSYAPSGNSPSSVPGVNLQATVPGGRVPLSPDRQTFNYNGVGGSQQFALNTPQRNLELANASAENTRQNKALDTQSEKQAETIGQNSGLDMVRRVFGHPIPDELADTLQIPRGTPRLDSELPGLQEVAQKLTTAKNEALSGGIDIAARSSEIPQNQAEWDSWRASFSPQVQAKIPATFNKMSVAMVKRMGIPVAQQPEFDIKSGEANAMQNLSPAEIKTMVDGSINPGKYPDENQRAFNDAQNALHLGLGTKGVQAAIKDGSDRVAQRENAITQAQVTSMPFREAALQNQQFQQTQQSYQFHAAELDKLASPVTDEQQNLKRLNDTLSQGTPQADALVGPQLVRLVSGAQGGLAGTVPLVEQAVGGRSKWQDLQATIQKWSTDPKAANSITPEQRNQIHSLADVLTQASNQRQQILMKARSALAGASGPEQHRAILADTMNKLGAVNASGAAPIIQKSPSTGQFRYSTDGGKTWQPGQPPNQQ